MLSRRSFFGKVFRAVAMTTTMAYATPRLERFKVSKLTPVTQAFTTIEVFNSKGEILATLVKDDQVAANALFNGVADQAGTATWCRVKTSNGHAYDQPIGNWDFNTRNFVANDDISMTITAPNS